MSGSAGLSPSRNRKREDSTLSDYARNLRKECADLAAGQAVLTAEDKLAKEIAGLSAAVLKVSTARTFPVTRLVGELSDYRPGSCGRWNPIPVGVAPQAQPSGRTPDASSCYGDDEQMTE